MTEFHWSERQSCGFILIKSSHRWARALALHFLSHEVAGVSFGLVGRKRRQFDTDPSNAIDEASENPSIWKQARTRSRKVGVMTRKIQFLRYC